MTAIFLFLAPISASMAQVVCPEGILSFNEISEVAHKANGKLYDVYDSKDVNAYIKSTGVSFPFKYDFVAVYSEDGDDVVYVAYFTENGCQVQGHAMELSEIKKFEMYLKGV